MPGKKIQLTPLETRKQLLLVESELNRAQLINEVRDFKDQILHLKHQVLGLGSTVSLAARLAATFSAVGRPFSRRDEDGRSSWISTLFKCAKAGTSLWLLLRSFRRRA